MGPLRDLLDDIRLDLTFYEEGGETIEPEDEKIEDEGETNE